MRELQTQVRTSSFQALVCSRIRVHTLNTSRLLLVRVRSPLEAFFFHDDTRIENQYRKGHDSRFEMPESTWEVEKFKRRGLYPPMVPQAESWTR